MSPPSDGWRRDAAGLVVAAACVVLVLLSLGPSLVGARVFAATDLALSYAPWRASQPAVLDPDNACVSDTVDALLPAAAEFRRELLHGDVALWNSLAAGGTPLAAVPSNAVWSPLSLPYLALPTWLAPAWVKLLELAVTIGGMFLFLRRLSLARAASLLGGLAFATSGFMVSWTGWPHTRTAAFLPLLLWSLERLIQLRSGRAVVPVALTVTAMLLGGFPAVTGYGLYLAAAYVLVRLLLLTRPPAPRRAAFLRPGLLAAAGVALGVLLAAFQLLPFAAQVTGLDLSVRAQGAGDHLPLLGLVTTALPNAFGSCPGQDYVGPLNAVEVNAYAGGAVLVLVGLALRRRRRETPLGVRGFFVGAALVTVVLGWVGGPLLAAAQHLPVFADNYVGRIRVVLGFCLAVLAAMGFDALLRARQERRARAWLAVELVGWAAAAGAAALGVHRLRAFLQPTGYLAESDRQTVYAAVGVAVVLVAVAFAGGRARSLALAAVPVVVLVQALLVVLPSWPQLPREEFYPETPTHVFLADSLGSERFEGTALAMLPGTSVYYDLRSLGGHAFTATTWRELIEAADASAFRTPGYSSVSSSYAAARSPALDRFSVRYLVVAPEQQAFGPVEQVGVATGRVTVPAGGQLDVPLPGGPLRGAGLVLVGAPQVDGDLEVEVRRGQEVLVRSGRRLLPTTKAGPLPVATAGEDLPAGPAVLRVRNRTGGPVSLAADAGGVPVLSLVRPTDDGLRVAHAASSATTWERTTALPRLRWASAVELAAQGPASLQAAGSSPARPGTVVLAADPAGASGAAGSVRPVKDGPDTVEVDVSAQGAGYLVVADGLQEGWTATVDGEPVALLPADHALVAVPLSAGQHRVRLAYTPRGLRPGLLVSALTALLLGAVVFAGSRRPARR